MGSGMGGAFGRGMGVGRYWSSFARASARSYSNASRSSRFQNKLSKMSNRTLDKKGNNMAYAMERNGFDGGGGRSGMKDGTSAGILKAYRDAAAQRGIDSTGWGTKPK